MRDELPRARLNIRLGTDDVSETIDLTTDRILLSLLDIKAFRQLAAEPEQEVTDPDGNQRYVLARHDGGHEESALTLMLSPALFRAFGNSPFELRWINRMQRYGFNATGLSRGVFVDEAVVRTLYSKHTLTEQIEGGIKYLCVQSADGYSVRFQRFFPRNGSVFVDMGTEPNSKLFYPLSKGMECHIGAVPGTNSYEYGVAVVSIEYPSNRAQRATIVLQYDNKSLTLPLFADHVSFRRGIVRSDEVTEPLDYSDSLDVRKALREQARKLPLAALVKYDTFTGNVTFDHRVFVDITGKIPHAELQWFSPKGTYVVRDRGSSNGTFVNGKLIDNSELYSGGLTNGTSITLGGNVKLYHESNKFEATDGGIQITLNYENGVPPRQDPVVGARFVLGR